MALLIVIALLCGIFAPSDNQAQQERVETPPEIRVGDLAQIADIDEVKDANAPNGMYKKTDKGWSYIPDSAENDQPPKAAVTASMKAELIPDELAETIGGALILALCGVAAWKASGIGRKKSKVRPGNGTSQIELQALMRRINTVAEIMENVVPDVDGAKAVEIGRRKKR